MKKTLLAAGVALAILCGCQDVGPLWGPPPGQFTLPPAPTASPAPTPSPVPTTYIADNSRSVRAVPTPEFVVGPFDPRPIIDSATPSVSVTPNASPTADVGRVIKGAIAEAPAPTYTHLPYRPAFKRGQQSIVTKIDGGGQAGTGIAQNGWIGFYGASTALPNLELNWWASAQGLNTLYAPTMKLGEGNCIEMSVDYWSVGYAATARALRIADFCDPDQNGNIFRKNLNIDDNFAKAYLRDTGRGPQFRWMEFRNRAGSWVALIANYQQRRWEVLWVSRPANWTEIMWGWSIVETHYTVGACTSLPPIYSTELAVFGKNGWQQLDGSTGAAYHLGDCWDPADATYSLENLGGVYSWKNSSK